MQQHVLIVGPRNSGKTKQALLFCKEYKKEEVEILSYNNIIEQKNHFAFSSCTKKTKLIVIDEFYELEQVKECFYWIYNGIKIDKKFHEPFVIKPRFVFVLSGNYQIEQLVQEGKYTWNTMWLIQTNFSDTNSFMTNFNQKTMIKDIYSNHMGTIEAIEAIEAINTAGGNCIVRQYGDKYCLLDNRFNPLRNLTKLTFDNLQMQQIISYDGTAKLWRTMPNTTFALTTATTQQ